MNGMSWVLRGRRGRLVGRAQQPGRMRRIGALMSRPAEDPRPVAAIAAENAGPVSGLAKLFPGRIARHEQRPVRIVFPAGIPGADRAVSTLARDGFEAVPFSSPAMRI
jgi:hypothetical protein